MKNEPYWITVGVPMYNSEKYIERCINSIINQTYQNIEIIIVNDGSTDDSMSIANTLNENYTGNKKIKIFSKNNEGLSKTRNYIIKKSTCEFIYFIDSDDWLENDAIEKLVELQCKYNCDIVKMNYSYDYNENKSVKSKLYSKYKNKLIKIKQDENNITKDIIYGNIVSYTWTMLIRKNIITTNFLFEDCHQEDKIFFIKILSNIETIFFYSKNLYHYYINENGIMHKHTFEYYLKQDMTLHNRINNIIKEFYNNDIELQIINNTMTLYFIERNLFNIYKADGKDKLFEIYGDIKKYWNEICLKVDFNCLKNSNYAKKGDYYIKLWKKEDFVKIIKNYNRELKFENLKGKIKHLLGKY